MIALVSRTGRQSQRYDNGFRLVAGCIPYRYKRASEACNGDVEDTLEVLMVTPLRGQGLVFPKGGWEIDETKEEAARREALEEAGVLGEIKACLGSWDFKSRFNRAGHSISSRKGYMFAYFVTEQLEDWPEQNVRQRKWVTITEAKELCRREWMRAALDRCVSHLSRGCIVSLSSFGPVDDSVSQGFPSQLSDEEQSQQSLEHVACEEMVSILADSKRGDIIHDYEPSSCLTEENTSSDPDDFLGFPSL